MTFRKINFIYSKNHLKAINIIFGKLIWFLNVKSVGRY